MSDATLHLLMVLAAAALVTYGWRALGVLLSGRLSADSQLFEWVTCVAYALLAALVARMILMPNGPLTQTLLADRLAATALAVVVFFLLRRSVLFGAVAGAGGLALFDWLNLFG